MNRKLMLILTVVLSLAFFANCSKGVKMHQSKEKTAGGLNKMGSQLDPGYQGTTTIPEDLKYPDMVDFDATSAIDFRVSDDLDTVAQYFENELGATLTRKSLEDGHMYEAKIKGWEIEIFTYEGGSHLRYKKQVK